MMATQCVGETFVIRQSRTKPVPPEFRQQFIAHGWRHVEHLYGARTDLIRKWIGQCGGLDVLQAERKARRMGKACG